MLDGILQEARRLNELIANLVFATRLEAGEVALRREWTSIEELIGSALRRARPQLGRRPVDLVDAHLPLVEADPVLLEQAVFLLIDNAAHHTPPGTRVAVRTFAVDGGLVVEIADTGAASLRRCATGCSHVSFAAPEPRAWASGWRSVPQSRRPTVDRWSWYPTRRAARPSA